MNNVWTIWWLALKLLEIISILHMNFSNQQKKKKKNQYEYINVVKKRNTIEWTNKQINVDE